MITLKIKPEKGDYINDVIKKAASEMFICDEKEIVVHDELLRVGNKCYLYNVIDNTKVLLIETNNPYKRNDYERNDDRAMLDFKRR